MDMTECEHGYPLDELRRCAFCKRTLAADAPKVSLPSSEWERAARHTIWEFARSGQPFTSEDVTARIGFPDETHAPNGRNNRIGTMIQSLAKQYGYRQVDERMATNLRSNGRTIKVWQGRKSS